jgi:hypothetical protein
MSVFLAPTFGVGYQGMTLNGALLSGGQITTYQAGTSTLQPTYTTSAGTIQNTNPIILDASGKPPSEVWLTQGQAYKFVVMDSLSNVIATYDNVSGINDVASSNAFSEWVTCGASPTYISPTQFSVPGNLTTTLQVGRRIQATCTAGVVYGYISVSAYTSLTTVTVVMDSTSLDNGLSIVNVGTLNATNPSIPYGITVQNATNATTATSATSATSATNSGTSGTFTITGTGFTVNPTATATWRKNNGFVTLYIPANSMLGTSNSTSFNLTGLPAGLSPTSIQKLQLVQAFDAGNIISCFPIIGAGGTSINLNPVRAGQVWTASGSKILDATTLSWSVD